DRQKGVWHIPCENCGRYTISDEALAVAVDVLTRTPALRPCLAHAIRRMAAVDGEPKLYEPAVLEQILRDVRLPDPAVQVANLVEWLGSNTTPGQRIEVRTPTHQAIIGAADHLGVDFVLEYGISSQLLDGERVVRLAGLPEPPGQGTVARAYAGSRRYESS